MSGSGLPGPRWRATLEILEDRLVPAGNLLVTTAGAYPQQFFKEFTPTGTLVRSVAAATSTAQATGHVGASTLENWLATNAR